MTDANPPRTRFGVLLPHFSDHATAERLFGFAPRVEQLGFDSVWARDALSFSGRRFEDAGRFIDPFVTLSAIAGVTSRLTLGTAVMIPFRHPLVSAQLVGSLAWASGGRLELGVGPGTPREPFDLTGLRYEDRIVRCRETVEVIRAVAAGPNAAYHGASADFEGATIDPAPPADLTVWYGGGSSASIRRALRYCDGLQPGLCPMVAWDRLAAEVRRREPAAGKRLKLGAIPLVALAPTREKAIARVAAAVPPLCDFMSAYYQTPMSSADDLNGALFAGSADDLIEGLAQYAQRGADLVILDARLLMDEFEDVVTEIGERVLPAVREVRAVHAA